MSFICNQNEHYNWNKSKWISTESRAYESESNWIRNLYLIPRPSAHCQDSPVTDCRHYMSVISFALANGSILSNSSGLVPTWWISLPVNNFWVSFRIHWMMFDYHALKRPPPASSVLWVIIWMVLLCLSEHRWWRELRVTLLESLPRSTILLTVLEKNVLANSCLLTRAPLISPRGPPPTQQPRTRERWSWPSLSSG